MGVFKICKQIKQNKRNQEKDRQNLCGRSLYNKLVENLYKQGKAINMAAYLEIDAVIDPADTRKWIMQGLKSAPARDPHEATHSFVDTW